MHSLPGAPAAVFLDFDGYGSYAPFDTDGSPDSFGPAEQAAIAEAWRQVASYFSMLDLDVTTEPPGVPYSYSIISNTVKLGQNLGNFPSVAPTNFNTTSHATDRPTALAHEIGHSFGLQHQSVFDLQGNKTDEYAPGYDALHGPIMGLDYARDVHKWFIGHPSGSPLLLQDDLAVMAATIKPYTGGDGFRPDDVAGALDAAAAMDVDASGVRRAAGIIEQLSDRDAYILTSDGGAVTLDLVPPQPSMLDGKLEVYAADGTLIAAADGPANDQHLVFPSLAAGTYCAVVSSHGDYADVGPYELTVRQSDGAIGPGPEYSPLPAPGGLAAANGPGTAVELRWDAVAGAIAYVVDRSDDGLVWQQIGSTIDGDALAYTDAGLPGGHRYFYRVSAADARAEFSAPSPVRTIVNAPDAVAGLAFTNWKSQALVLNWRDVSGESGYRVERRTVGTGGDFSVVGELGPNVISFTDKSFALEARYQYRVAATSPAGDSTAVEVSGSTPLTTIDALQVIDRQPSQVSLLWQPVWGAVGYSIERSVDGVNFTQVATTAANSFTDDSVEPVRLYYYRVKGTNDLHETGTSAAVFVATPAAVPLPARWRVADVGSAGSGVSRTLASGSVVFNDDSGTMRLVGGGKGTFVIDPANGSFRHDSFRFVYRDFTGDGTFTARVSAQGSTPLDSLAGVMIRDGLADGAAFVFNAVSLQLRNVVQTRSQTSETASAFRTLAVPKELWLRIVRTGNAFTLSTTPGGGAWTVRATYTVPMGDVALAGIVVCSGSDDALTSASFDNVQVADGGLFITTPAAATPAAVTGTSTALSVLGIDDGGQANLTYTWSALSMPPGTPPPTFNRNGDNLAGNVTARFARTGHYILAATVNDRQGHSLRSTVAVDVLPKPTLEVTPLGVAVPAGGTLQFSASWVDQFGSPVEVTATPVVWLADYGTFDADGSYTAPTGWSGFDRVNATADHLSVTRDVYVYDDAAGPALLSAASRKVHGRRGVFDLPLSLNRTTPTVEPRRGGPTTLVLNLSAPVTAADGALDAGEFLLTNALFKSAVLNGAVLVLEVTAIKNGAVMTAELRGLVDANGNPLQGNDAVVVRAAEGDVNADRFVGQADLLAVRRRLRRPAVAGDFLCDVDCDGMVTAADLLAVRRRWATSIA